MKFYDREIEVASLQKIEQKSNNFAQMTIVTGRRRIGKTALLKRAFSVSPVLYFFVEKKTELLLCEEFTQQIKSTLKAEIFGEIKTFKALFAFLMNLSETLHFTLIIDEFQEFRKINPAVFSEMQNVWDAGKDQSKMNLVICGSIYSMMKHIFENSKEPLFGRATAKINIQPFSTSTLKNILADNNPKFTNEDLLAFYMITGGVAKYVEQLIDNKLFTKKNIFTHIFSTDSFFLTEGKDVLIDEFGKDYGIYFSILSLIASSKTGRGDIESTLGFDVGGYLDKLENEYNIIKRHRPFGAKEGSRNNKYFINDNFLSFWFRFIYKYRSAVEIGNLDYVRNIVERDYETYSGLILEKYFRTQLIETKQFSAIGSYWNRKGENEIDIIAENEMEKRLVFYEVKRNENRINLSVLEQKASEMVKKYPDYQVEYKKLSLEKM
ncbi:ATPase [Bacteroidia bacterium]|nr:ATPase [Bacteroidia bacterium]